ncbi:MAG: DUF4239 domain-containing protein [Chlamydiales bacterium]|nr:DUF4239 domain-containing protein [Chlamydiales bacterium]
MGILDHKTSLSWMAEAYPLIIIFLFFAISGVFLVRKLVNRAVLKAHHDVAGFVFTNLGVLYAVLLGFTVVNVQQRYDKLQDIAEVEASFVSELYRDAEVFSQKDKESIRSSLKKYCEGVINEEWDLMGKKMPSPKTLDAVKGIWNSYYAVELSHKKQEIWYAESISKLNELVNARLSRLLGSEESLSSQMWMLLIVGGLILVAFVWFFALENTTSHVLMVMILATTTAFLLVLIYSLDTAFSGDVSIQPEALVKVLNFINTK